MNNQSNETIQLNSEIGKGKPNVSIINANNNENVKGTICDINIPEANKTVIAADKCLPTQTGNSAGLDSNSLEVINNANHGSKDIILLFYIRNVTKFHRKCIFQQVHRSTGKSSTL